MNVFCAKSFQYLRTPKNMLDSNYFVYCGRHQNDVNTNSVFYIRGGGLVLESTDRLTGTVRPIACVQMRSKDCPSVLVPKSQETAGFVGHHDAFALFGSDANLEVVLTNLTTSPTLKIDMLATNEPQDITDYHDDRGKSVGSGMNKVNELGPYQSYCICGNQRVQDARGNHARLKVLTARDLATATGTSTLAQEASLSTPSGASSEMFLTVTPRVGSDAERLVDTACYSLVWKVADFVVIKTERYRPPSCVAESSYFGVVRGPQVGSDRGAVRVVLHSGGDVEDTGMDDSGDDMESTSMDVECSRGVRDTPQSAVVHQAVYKGAASSALVSRLHSDLTDVVAAAGRVTGASYNHSLRTQGFAVRLAVAAPGTLVFGDLPRTPAEVAAALGTVIGADLDATELYRIILEEERFAQERAMRQLEEDVISGSQKVFTSGECVVCLEEKCDIVILRCMHNCLHAACLDALKRASGKRSCPLCRSMIQGCVAFG